MKCVDVIRAAILQRFPPGKDRRRWLAWLKRLEVQARREGRALELPDTWFTLH